MSLELLPTLEKDVVSKKKTSSENTTETKKEGTSLFDSLLSDAKKEKPKDTLKHDSSDSKETPLNSKKSTSTSGQKLEDKETPVKKMVNSLVDIVVDGSKKESVKTKKTDTTLLNNKSSETTNLTKSLDASIEIKEVSSNKIKQNVESKVDLIKETAKEISNIVEKESLTADEVNKAVKINSKAQDILDKVEQKVKVIKETTSKIKEDINVVTIKEHQNKIESDETNLKKEIVEVKVHNEKVINSVEDKINTIEKTSLEIQKEIDNSTKKNIKSENIDIKDTKTIIDDDLPTKIEQKVEVIKENAVEIQKDIVKVVVSSDELVKRIQEFKNETKEIDSLKTTPVVNVSIGKESATGKETDKNSLLSNGFLTSQKQEKQQVSLTNLKNAKTNIEENKTIGAVKESASILELNPEEVEIEKVGKEGESKSELFSKHEKQVQEQFSQNKSLNKMVIEGQKNSEIINEEIQKKVAETKGTQEENQNTTKAKEVVVNVNVPQAVVETIQSKIIGAQQRVGSFMSEVARNMYLNYKPPFTAFRMSLNPANLGTISIVMRANNQDNNISVSMNMSNNATLDSIVENKAALQNALQRQLGEASNITLNFGMDDGNSSESFNDTMNQSNSQNSSGESIEQQDQEINNSLEQEQEKSLDYM